jgi:MFS family permease
VFGALAAAGALVHPLYVSVDLWMALRVLVGFAIAGLLLVTESWINARATAATRGTLLAIYMVLFLLAAAAGQFAVGLGDPALYQPFSFAAILIALSLVPLSLTRSPSPELEAAPRMQLRTLSRISLAGTAGAFTSGLTMTAYLSLAPIYAARMGLQISEIGTFMGVAVLAAMALQWPVGYLSDVVRRHWMLAIVAAAAAGAAVLTALVAAFSTLVLYATAALFYGLGSCIYPLALAVVQDRLDGRDLVPASATFLLVFGIGSIIGPVVAGGIIGMVGPSGLFLFLAVALGALALLALRSPSYEEIPEVASQDHFVTVVPVSTPVLLELDPRNEQFTETPPKD